MIFLSLFQVDHLLCRLKLQSSHRLKRWWRWSVERFWVSNICVTKSSNGILSTDRIWMMMRKNNEIWWKTSKIQLDFVGTICSEFDRFQVMLIEKIARPSFTTLKSAISLPKWCILFELRQNIFRNQWMLESIVKPEFVFQCCCK